MVTQRRHDVSQGSVPPGDSSAPHLRTRVASACMAMQQHHDIGDSLQRARASVQAQDVVVMVLWGCSHGEFAPTLGPASSTALLFPSTTRCGAQRTRLPSASPSHPAPRQQSHLPTAQAPRIHREMFDRAIESRFDSGRSYGEMMPPNFPSSSSTPEASRERRHCRGTPGVMEQQQQRQR